MADSLNLCCAGLFAQRLADFNDLRLFGVGDSNLDQLVFFQHQVDVSGDAFSDAVSTDDHHRRQVVSQRTKVSDLLAGQGLFLHGCPCNAKSSRRNPEKRSRCDTGPVMLAAQHLQDLLLARGWTLCVAESLTAGHVQANISSVSGSSQYFLGGMTCYTIDQKVALLGIDSVHAAAVNCVSQTVARQMAAGVRTRFGADVSIATTGYSEPWGDISIPRAHMVVDLRGRQVHCLFEGPGLGRVAMQQATASAAIGLLIAELTV